MSKPDDNFPYQADIIKEMFIRTADENYVVARWAYQNDLITDFFWNSVHALEKYMKAVLLLNGRSVKKFSHGIEELYKEVKELAGELLPQVLTQPPTLQIAYWSDLGSRLIREGLRSRSAPVTSATLAEIMQNIHPA